MKLSLFCFYDPALQAYTHPMPKQENPKDFIEAIRRQLVKKPDDEIGQFWTYYLGEFDDCTGELVAEKALILKNDTLIPKPKEETANG